jgi:gliding motility-associated protein GldL
MSKSQDQLQKKSGFQKFQDLTQSKSYKTFMAYVYGIGASVVMIGAYFKLTHIPGADIMLGVGLGVEAIIFFLSAFEPVHLDYKWDNVFVELEDEWDGESRTKFGATNAGSGAVSNMENKILDEMFSKMNVSEDTFKKISKGLDKLAENAANIADVSGAMAATNNYAATLEKATKAVTELSTSYTKANEKIASTLGQLDFSALDSSVIKKIATSMQSLNSIYELQLQSSEQTAEVNKKLNQSMNKYLESMNATSENAAQFNQQMSQLSSRISALNNVYGGMLSAMNIKA